MNISHAEVRKHSFFKILVLTGFITFFFSCSVFRPAGYKTGDNLFKTFYVGKEGTQYYINPLSFESKENSQRLSMDFTFRYKDDIKDSATVNLSLFSPQILKNLDSISIANANHSVMSKKIKLFYNKKEKKGFLSRFSTKIALKDINEIFKNSDWKIGVYKNGTIFNFIPSKRTKRDIEKLRDNVFILF